jgi:DNA-binding transcriptional LysR family regulator
MNINLHLLRIFYTVAEQKSFSRAAGLLFISQPAVSRAVRELEHQLGLPLIERGAGGARPGKGMRLTESGQAMFEHARGIFALERAALEDVRARVGLARGRLVIGASTTIAGYWLHDYTARLVRAHPTAALEVRVGNTQGICEQLIDCAIDVALVEGAVSDARIAAVHWRDDELRIVTRPDSMLAKKRKPGLAQLNAETWLLREAGSGTREFSARMMEQHGIQPQRIIEFGSNEGIVRAVAAGVGIAMMPTQVARELYVLKQIKAVNYPHPGAMIRPLFLLTLRGRPLSPLARAFCTLLAPQGGAGRQ